MRRRCAGHTAAAESCGRGKKYLFTVFFLLFLMVLIHDARAEDHRLARNYRESAAAADLRSELFLLFLSLL